MRQKLYLYSFVSLTVLYVVLALALPADPEALKHYHLTQAQVRLLVLTIVVPFVAIWFSALYGFLKFKAYAVMVKGSTEGKAFNDLADGLMILAFALPISGIASSLLAYIGTQYHHLLPMVTIVRNYLSLVLAGGYLLLVAKGAEGLLRTLRPKATTARPRYGAPALIILSSFFTWLIIVQPGSKEVSQAAYYLPDWLLIATLTIPYLYIWYQGTRAAYLLHAYQQRVKGQIYKQAFGDLVLGISVIVALSILLQFLAASAAQLNRLKLTPILLIIYLLVALYAVGYGLVAKGAKKLKKFEEV